MGLSYQSGDYAREFNSLYKITLDMSNWDRTTVQLVSPMSGGVYIYGSNDGGSIIGQREGSPKTAQNFNPVQATNLATGTASSGLISSAGDYEISINAQYLRLQGNPAAAGTSIYKILFNHSKVS